MNGHLKDGFFLEYGGDAVGPTLRSLKTEHSGLGIFTAVVYTQPQRPSYARIALELLQLSTSERWRHLPCAHFDPSTAPLHRPNAMDSCYNLNIQNCRPTQTYPFYFSERHRYVVG